jgi:transcriptional regulator with XRE-family HTH domain
MSKTPAIKRTPAANKEVDRQELAQRLKNAREYMELSQDEVAALLKVPRSAISLIESGQRRVEALELQRLAEIYLRPIGYFTGEAVEPAALPASVQHLIRTASKLTDQDREELQRFAEFLQSRGRS